MRGKLRVMAAFALLGFIVPWVLLAYSYLENSRGHAPNGRVFLWLCPSSIMSLGLDNASVKVGLVGWLLIGVSNAVLYGVVRIVVSLFVPKRAH
jgi:hypothetical protein